jgi:hypothetical protein
MTEEKKKLKKKLLLDIRSNKVAMDLLSENLSKALEKAMDLEEKRTELKEENEKIRAKIQELEIVLKEDGRKEISEIYTDRFGTTRGKCEGREVQWSWSVSLFHFSDSGDYIFNYQISKEN